MLQGMQFFGYFQGTKNTLDYEYIQRHRISKLVIYLRVK